MFIVYKLYETVKISREESLKGKPSFRDFLMEGVKKPPDWFDTPDLMP